MQESRGEIESGFSALVPFRSVTARTDVQLSLQARLRDGTLQDVALGTVTLLPLQRAPIDPTGHEPQRGEPLVAICMATYNPPLDLLEQQIESIRRQTHQNWVCWISDDCSDPAIYAEIQRIVARDQRFHVDRSDIRRGFYANFERCLGLVPSGAGYIALADQDDFWYPEKLIRSLSAFDRDTCLVYTDMHVVDRIGAMIYPTFWTKRRNNHTDFFALIWANTVTGAASVFRRELLADILPFPARIGQLFHDHWIACVALARGSIAYVDAPLYGYRQHSENVIGHTAGLPARLPRVSSVLRSLVSPAFFKAKMTAILWSRLDGYHLNVLRTATIAQTLRLRGVAATEHKRRALDRLAGCDHSLISLLLESLEATVRRRPTLGTEWYATRGFVANRLLSKYSVRRGRMAARTAADVACGGNPGV